ncbi:hypothetical protein [Pseudomonas cremoricolorata]|uniref:hypothetical protein n=1 Tax=Pseudomonas cremoricolorata TaxID=157783 RepID=UPI00040505BD|nr:hypothetical protein [Pseudomonas cremoricolorata]
MKRWLRFAALLLVGGAGLWVWSARQALHDFPDILPAYSAKEYCSCRFVMGFDAAYCRRYVEQYLPLASLEEDTARQSVSAQGLGRRQQAAVQGAGEGCRLLP